MNESELDSPENRFSRMRAEELLSDSASWVHSLDRSVLGSLAMPSDVLIVADATERSRENFSSNPDILCIALLQNAAVAARAQSGVTTFTEEYDGRVKGELAFWWKTNRGMAEWDYNLLRHAKADYIELCELYSEHLGMHGYFDAGIRDIGFIYRCIAEGIDPDLAASAIASEK